MEKVYVVMVGTDYLSWEDGGRDGPEEFLDKIFTTRQKAVAYVTSKTGTAPDEYDRVDIDLADYRGSMIEHVTYYIYTFDLD